MEIRGKRDDIPKISQISIIDNKSIDTSSSLASSSSPTVSRAPTVQQTPKHPHKNRSASITLAPLPNLIQFSRTLSRSRSRSISHGKEDSEEREEAREQERAKMKSEAVSWAHLSPLMACILGPLSILLGIPALSQRWRGSFDDGVLIDTIPDPTINLVLSGISLLCEIAANLILMLRFSDIQTIRTTRLSLALWILKVVFSIANYVEFVLHHPPGNGMAYLEGFYIGAASMVISGIVIFFLIFNIVIATPDTADKKIRKADALKQRTFMIRVTILVVAMGLGALIFSQLEHFSFVTGLYLVTVSLLTVGFGDVVMITTWGRVIMFPYLIFSISYLWVIVEGIAELIRERLNARRQGDEMKRKHELQTVKRRRINIFKQEGNQDTLQASTLPLQRQLTLQEEVERLAHEKAREDLIRQVRACINAFVAFAAFWTIGAAIFSATEGWAYGTSLYFCYVFFMTVGYGDYSPNSQAGRVLFIVYAILAVPTVTFAVQTFTSAFSFSQIRYDTKKARIKRIKSLPFESLGTMIAQDLKRDTPTTRAELPARMLDNMRRLDRHTRQLVQPFLHTEARLLLKVESVRLNTHFGEDATEEPIGQSTLEREREHIKEYRLAFALILSDLEVLAKELGVNSLGEEGEDLGLTRGMSTSIAMSGEPLRP